MPDYSVITNITSAHIGNLGSKRNIARAKLEILDGKNDTVLIGAKNEPLILPYTDITYSLGERNASVNLTDIKCLDDSIIFNIHSEKESERKILGWDRTHFLTACYCF